MSQNGQMTEAEAKAEHDAIQAEIAKEKGYEAEEAAPEKEEEVDEPADDTELEDEPTGKPERKVREALPEDEDEGIDPESESKNDRKIPLSKYQATKKKLETENLEKAAEIERLTTELNKQKTDKTVSEKVKAYAEKTGQSEEDILDLVQLIRGDNALDKETREVIQQSAIALKKQAALDAFQSEVDTFVEEFPEAAGHEADFRKLAFEKENLGKSLYEIYHRQIKSDPAPKKKTGEVSRGATRQTGTAFDVDKIIAKAESGASKPFDGLSDAQIDEVFAKMEKTGSRYTNNH